MQVGIAPFSIGFIIGIIVLLVTVVLVITGGLPLWPTAVLIGLLAIARLC
jgi:heme/copper-type cytochrome/quinol oxidase subunit 4